MAPAGYAITTTSSCNGSGDSGCGGGNWDGSISSFPAIGWGEYLGGVWYVVRNWHTSSFFISQPIVIKL